MKIYLNIVGNSNDENNFMHKLVLTNAQGPKLCKAFANGSTVNIKLSLTQIGHKIEQLSKYRTIGRILGPLLKLDCL